jgi:hypothetical protein
MMLVFNIDDPSRRMGMAATARAVRAWRLLQGVGMTPWRATCVQMRSEIAAVAAGRDDARRIIAHNVGHAVDLTEALCAGRDAAPRLVVLPEFALQGPPHHLEPPEWGALACCPVPGAITAPLQALAKRHGIYIGGNQFEAPAEWPGRFFNCSFLINPHGEVILRFRRINTALWPSPHDLMDAYLKTHGHFRHQGYARPPR